ncbi:PREDICTED: uncharacterized protein LOC109476624 [Branchiostoma belcheri]|uniref:Uncharacterized protein LOC109476624 n=1 Tax=Branchiostoma belcheri TaxID=7741 RepID=A0A6P4ZQG7_BRABE|nr:PREDICTED: uncharacterized protein LOC109476624 [Branchiostoma belcheri]
MGTAGQVYTTFARHKSYGLQAQQRTVHMPSTLHPLDIPNSEKGCRTQKAVGKVSEQDRQTGRQSLAGKLVDHLGLWTQTLEGGLQVVAQVDHLGLWTQTLESGL